MSQYTMASEIWPGLGKAIEEMGEFLVNAGKLQVNHGQRIYSWGDKQDLGAELQDEAADVIASVLNFAACNDFDIDAINERIQSKLNKYAIWIENNE